MPIKYVPIFDFGRESWRTEEAWPPLVWGMDQSWTDSRYYMHSNNGLSQTSQLPDIADTTKRNDINQIHFTPCISWTLKQRESKTKRERDQERERQKEQNQERDRPRERERARERPKERERERPREREIAWSW